MSQCWSFQFSILRDITYSFNLQFQAIPYFKKHKFLFFSICFTLLFWFLTSGTPIIPILDLDLSCFS